MLANHRDSPGRRQALRPPVGRVSFEVPSQPKLSFDSRRPAVAEGKVQSVTSVAASGLPLVERQRVLKPWRARRRRQIAARRALRETRRARTLPPRGANGLGAQPPAHLHDSRHRRARRPLVHRHGMARRCHAQPSHPGQKGRLAGAGRSDRRRSGCDARAGHRPSRHQARQHLRHATKSGEDSGLRSGHDFRRPRRHQWRTNVRGDASVRRSADQSRVDLGNHNYPWFARDKNYDRLRGDADYERILTQVHAEWDRYRRLFAA